MKLATYRPSDSAIDFSISTDGVVFEMNVRGTTLKLSAEQLNFLGGVIQAVKVHPEAVNQYLLIAKAFPTPEGMEAMVETLAEAFNDNPQRPKQVKA